MQGQLKESHGSRWHQDFSRKKKNQHLPILILFLYANANRKHETLQTSMCKLYEILL